MSGQAPGERPPIGAAVLRRRRFELQDDCRETRSAGEHGLQGAQSHSAVAASVHRSSPLGGGGDMNGRWTMPRLLEAIGDLCNGTIDENVGRELDELLASDAQTRRVYTNYM